jgi:pyruvate/2-oxoglutarate dehydrogenase complex dihydrolipoamide acyltransferase (E2) component
MVHKVRMPRVDANVEEGAVGAWLKEVGQRVEAGEPLVEIITDKASFELECDVGGVLRGCTASEKSVVPVGYVLALLSDSADEPLPDVTQENEEVMQRHREAMLLGASETEPAAEQRAPSARDSTGGPGAAARLKATPAARHLARQAGVRLQEIPVADGGVIRETDVQEYLRERRPSQERAQ